MINVYAFPGIRETDLPEELIQNKVSALEDLPLMITHEMVCETIKEVTGLSYEKFKSPKRDRYLVRARMLYLYYARTLMEYTLQEIGIVLGRHHTTIMHNIDEYHKLCEEDPNFKKVSDRVRLLIKVKGYRAAQLEVSLSNNELNAG